MILGLILCISSNKLHAQEYLNTPIINVDSLYRANLESRIPLNLILGTWISKDSLESKLTFIEEAGMVNILPNPYGYPFSFRVENDCLVASGSATNWPPYYCILKLNEDHSLGITHFSYGSNNSYYRIYCRE